MSEMVPMYGFGGGGSAGKMVTVHVVPETGANVTCTNGKKTFTGTTDANGDAIFKLAKGAWTITAAKSGASVTQNVTVTADCTVNIDLNRIPTFTYTGTYKIVDDKDNVITSTLGNWKIRFLTSGTLTFTNLRGAANGIDVFLVGGGGGTYATRTGGGGGGYTKTARAIQVQTGDQYIVAVGDGGSTSGGTGGTTSAFGNTADGGKGCAQNVWQGGNGGSGGGGYGLYGAGAGGSDGGNGATGTDGGDNKASGGKGQGTTTREFAESTGRLYAGGGVGSANNLSHDSAGGAGGGASLNKSGTANTGGGAGAGIVNPAPNTGRKGGSGIVIIRNKR